MAKFITAKFASTCTETGVKISKGEPMLYDYSRKKCYSIYSEEFKKQSAEKAQAKEDRDLYHLVQSQEDAAIDNAWYGMNGDRY